MVDGWRRGEKERGEGWRVAGKLGGVERPGVQAEKKAGVEGGGRV